jgi:DNA-directed RNA polymerase subunit M/transcription elongation factor TFIIS
MVSFCQNCGNLLLPQKTPKQKIGIINLHCNSCQKTEEVMADGISYQVKTRIFHKDEERAQILESDFSVDPVCRQQCPKCGFTKAYYWQGGNRRKLEWESITYYRCLKCRNTWNE